MAEKVKVSREVAEALDMLFELNTANDIMRIYFAAINVNEARMIPSAALMIRDLEPMQLAVILLNGYEVVETPEEKALAYYNSFDATPLGEATEKMVIRKFLNTAEIKFKGIND